MTTIILVISIIVSVLGLLVAIWTMVDTRKQYYEEYLKWKKR